MSIEGTCKPKRTHERYVHDIESDSNSAFFSILCASFSMERSLIFFQYSSLLSFKQGTIIRTLKSDLQAPSMNMSRTKKHKPNFKATY